jgi:hypothetical protein
LAAPRIPPLAHAVGNLTLASVSATFPIKDLNGTLAMTAVFALNKTVSGNKTIGDNTFSLITLVTNTSMLTKASRANGPTWFNEVPCRSASYLRAAMPDTFFIFNC